jgi:hypothetical protein
MILLIPVSLDSKQILKQLSMISHTLSLVSMVPSGDSTSVRRTCRKYAEQTYKFQYINDGYLLNVRTLLFWDVTKALIGRWLPMFWDSLSVPSSRVEGSKKKFYGKNKD